ILLENARTQRERDLIVSVEQQVQEFLAEWALVDAEAPDPPELRSQAVRPAFEAALAALQEVEQHNQAEADAALAQSRRVSLFANLAGVAALVLLVTGVGAVLLGARHYILVPVSHLRGVIDRFRGGDLDARASEDLPVELAIIAGAFNDLAEEIS